MYWDLDFTMKNNGNLIMLICVNDARDFCNLQMLPCHSGRNNVLWSVTVRWPKHGLSKLVLKNKIKGSGYRVFTQKIHIRFTLDSHH